MANVSKNYNNPAIKENSTSNPFYSKSIRCSRCRHHSDSEKPGFTIECDGESNIRSIKVNATCGYIHKLFLNSQFEVTGHYCSAFREKDVVEEPIDDDEIDEFLESEDPLELFLKNFPSRKRSSSSGSSSLVSQMKSAMKVINAKLSQPLAILVPTKVQKKSKLESKSELER
ncbi:MAG: hypothetical protein ACTSUE_19115, partial [Promethearchaeota archaeon]